MTVRDERADFLRAHIEEYQSYRANGLHDRADAVARVLRVLGHDVGVKERAIPAPVERAVEGDEAPDVAKRRARKAAPEVVAEPTLEVDAEQ
jgi:hypothetical protein